MASVAERLRELENQQIELGWNGDAADLAAIRAEVEAIAKEMRDADRAGDDVDTGGLIDGQLADAWADRLAPRAESERREP